MQPIQPLALATALVLTFAAGDASGQVFRRGAKPPTAPETQMPDAAELEQRMLDRLGRGTKERAGATTDDGVQVVFQSGHSQDITVTAISADGRYAASGSSDGMVKLWDVASGQELRTYTGVGWTGPDRLGITTDNQRAFIADGMTLRFFDVQSGAKLSEYSAQMGQYALSGDARLLAVRGADRQQQKTVVIDTTDGRAVWTIPGSGIQDPQAMSADGKTLITRHTDIGVSSSLFRPNVTAKSQIQIWDVGAGKPRGQLHFGDDSIFAKAPMLTLSPDGKRAFAVSPATSAKGIASIGVYDTDSGALATTIALPAGTQLHWNNALSFSPDHRSVAVRTTDGQMGGDKVVLLDIETGQITAELKATAIGFGKDGGTVVLGLPGTGAPVIRELASGRETALAGGIAPVTAVTPLRDGSMVVAAMGLGPARVWDLATGTLVHSLACPGGSAAVTATASPIGSEAATGCSDGSVWLWDTRSGQTVRQLAPPLTEQYAFARVQFLPDGRRVVVGIKDQLSVRSVATGEMLLSITLPAAQLPSTMTNPMAAFPGAKDASTIKLGGMHKQFAEAMKKAQEEMQASIEENREQMEGMQEASSWMQAFAMHPGGKLLAVARAYDISVWDVDTGQMTRMLAGPGVKPPAAASEPQADPMAAMMESMMSGQRLSRKERKQLEKQMRELSKAGPMVRDPLASIDEIQDAYGMTAGAEHLVFNPDGRLLAVGVTGNQLWDVIGGAKLDAPKANRSGWVSPQAAQESAEEMMDQMLGNPMTQSSAAAFSPDGSIGAQGIANSIKLWDVQSGKEIAILTGHTSEVRSLAFTADGRELLSGGDDGALRIWSMSSRSEVAALIALGERDFVSVTPDQFYRASKTRIKGIAFRVKGEMYPFEQFDLRFNRPDILLERLGRATGDAVRSYRNSYQRRLRKMGLDESRLAMSFQVPEVRIESKGVPVSTSDTTLTLDVTASDAAFALDRLNLFINDVPLYGTQGLVVEGDAKMVQRSIRVPLVPGRNKIQVSALNKEGTESLKQTVYTTSTGAFPAQDIYVVAIGVSQYKNSAYNLRYAAKDAGDLLAAYQAAESPRSRGAIHVLAITDENATRDQIRRAKEWLAQAKPNDLAVVFAAGHGMTDTESNYYFGTHDIDPQDPAGRGLPYEDFEGLLDGIAPLQKLLLIDTCFSGEIDKEEPVTVAQADNAEGAVKMRSFKAKRGITVTADDSASGTAQLSTDVLRFQQDWFADLRRGTGAFVISSASGNEYALEGEKWSNGVFTYALLQGLKNAQADSNNDRAITVSELQAYVIDQVRSLTQGGQNPTVRRENLDYDFIVY
jgi:WD40 repeat protein